jgi:hypothetical protein
MIRNICWFSVLIGLEALSLVSLTAFVFTVLVWGGVLGGAF